MHNHRVSRDFRDAVNGLVGFKSAQDFLRKLADQRPPDFKLSAVTNAHLYYRDQFFVCRIEVGQSRILLTPKPNNGFWQGLEDGSASLFEGPLYKLIAHMGGFQRGWATVDGDGLVLLAATPADFFERLLGLIRGSRYLN